MNALTHTTTVLLERLLESGNVEVWLEFDARYRPIITSFARRLGLGDADADDVAQETLTRFLKAYRAGQYDRTKGRLSRWIVGIARHCAIDVMRMRAQRREWRGESAIGDLAAEDALTAAWDEECRQAIMDQAMRELRETSRMDERTIQAFELVAFEQRPAAEVASKLAVSIDSVYAAKNRCLTQLREIVARLNELYEVA
jgi:RNA polymerase sigma-70 factor (ECF subfamily)